MVMIAQPQSLPHSRRRGHASPEDHRGAATPPVPVVCPAFRTFHYSVFRLETRQVYAGSGEDEGLAAFHRGDPQPPPDPAEDEWATLLRANREAGRVQQRVHPVTDYASVVAACFARDAALHQAMPWAQYMTRHPDLVQRLPKGT